MQSIRKHVAYLTCLIKIDFHFQRNIIALYVSSCLSIFAIKEITIIKYSVI